LKYYNNKNSSDIELQLTEAFRDMASQPVLSPADVEENNNLDLSDYSSSELLQLAYDRVESEIDDLQSEMRKLRERHKAEELAIERRLIQKNALRNKILAEAAQ